MAKEKKKKTIENDSKETAFMEGLRAVSKGMPLKEVLERSEPENYSTNLKNTSCICGQKLKKGYAMHVPGTKIEYPAGECCYERHFGTREVISRERKNARKHLEDMINQPISEELMKRLAKIKLDPEIFLQIREAIKGGYFDDENFLYGTDPGKNRSFMNWFREGIREGVIDNAAVIEAYRDYARDPRLVSKERLALLAAYSHEFRRFDRDMVIGGVKDDLEYLSKLPEDHKFLKEFKRPNLDEAYNPPKTIFRNRDDDRGKKIKDKLNEDPMTFLDGWGIRRYFPGITRARIEANRETANTYGVGRSWDYLLNRLKPVFEELKENLHEEYKMLGEIVGEQVLSKNEYLDVRKFFKRSRMGGKDSREDYRDNYLRMFSIKEFEELAPKIVTIDRKLRFKTECGKDAPGECMLREDFDRDFVRITGIEDASPSKTIEMLANADENSFVENMNFLRFMKDHGKMIGKMYENGIIPRKYLASKKGDSSIRRYYGILKKEGVQEINDEDNGAIGKIREVLKSKYVKYIGNDSWIRSNQRFMSKKGRQRLLEDSTSLKKMIEQNGYDPSREDKYGEYIQEIKKHEGKILFSKAPWSLISNEQVSSQFRKYQHGNFETIYFKRLETLSNDLKNAETLKDDFFDKVKRISEGAYGEYFGTLDVNEYWYMKKEERKGEILGTLELVSSVNSMHSKMEKMIKMAPEDRSLELRRGIWENADKRKKYRMAMGLKSRITDMIDKDDDLKNIVGSLGSRDYDRKRSYFSKSVESFDISRFMGDGRDFHSLDWYKIASGQTVKYELHNSMRSRLKSDYNRGILSKSKYLIYESKLDDFEKKVNEEIVKDYLF